MTDTASGPERPPIVDWHGNERQWSEAEVALQNGRVARINREVAEIRRAAEQMAAKGDLFHSEVAEFLNAEALMLERANKGSFLRGEDDTQERPGMFHTAARRALLIARAYNWTG